MLAKELTATQLLELVEEVSTIEEQDHRHPPKQNFEIEPPGVDSEVTTPGCGVRIRVQVLNFQKLTEP